MQKIRDARDVALGRKLALDVSTPSIRNLGTGNEYRWGAPIVDEDREWAATREPVGHFATFCVSEDMYDNWFTVDDLATTGPDVELDLKVQSALTALHAKESFLTATILERVHGWSAVAVGFSDGVNLSSPVEGNPEIRDLYPYSKRKITVSKKDEEQDSVRYGLPLQYGITRSGGKAVQIHYSRIIHLATRFNLHSQNDWEGVSVLDDAMDDLATMRNLRWSFGQTMYRYGPGFPDIEITGASKEDIDRFYASGQFRDINARTYFAHSEKQKLEFKGVGGVALDPQKYYQPILESLAAATKIPEAVLRGAQAGSLTGSEVNERSYFKVVSSAQSQVEPYLRWLIDSLIASGQIDAQVKDYRISWRGGFEVNDKDHMTALLLEEQANQIRLEYMYIDDVRALKGLLPLPNGEGQKLRQSGSTGFPPIGKLVSNPLETVSTPKQGEATTGQQ